MLLLCKVLHVNIDNLIPHEPVILSLQRNVQDTGTQPT